MVFLAALSFTGTALAQAPNGGGNDKAQLDAIVKKLDEQNAKIDALSQEVLKIEQQLGNSRPGVMIGAPTPPPAAATSAPVVPANTGTPAGNSHVVARGETLTSIAKMHRVGVEDLQKFNHIENDRKLQIGQTIMIPAATGGSTAPSPSAPAPNE